MTTTTGTTTTTSTPTMAPRPPPATSLPLSPPPPAPSMAWRLASMAVMGSVGTISRCFLYGFNSVEVTGLHHLTGALDARRNRGPERGLLTVCNHVGVLDDPVMWGILPLRYNTDLANLRWGLGAHDICFQNRFLSTFFSLGQVLPTHRLWHSPLGGLYQPTMTQAIALLSGPGGSGSGSATASPASRSASRFFSTDGRDSFLAPAARLAWLHVFPEACCHQSSDSSLRYFKWGIARLILETDPAPDLIPMFIHGTQELVPEDRGWPRFLPRIGKQIRVAVGAPTRVDALFGPQRAEWQRLVRETGGEGADGASASARANSGSSSVAGGGSSSAERLQHHPEAVRLRIEVARAVRDEILKLRQSIGLPAEEDDSAALAETWSKEPNKRRFKSPVDGSLVSRH